MTDEPRPSPEQKLPVHGFVLAGGKSSRMGRDKALLPFRGRPMIEIAVEKLRSFCSAVSIVGNRNDLTSFAPVVTEVRTNVGPAAGLEAGMFACTESWAMFMPVDVPLVPVSFLRLWVEEALRVQVPVSYVAAWEKQPAFCLLQRGLASKLSAVLDTGEYRLEILLNKTAAETWSWMYDPYDLYGYPLYRGPGEEVLAKWFANINTLSQLTEAESWAEADGQP